jgi:hypothetical protein
MIPRILAIIPMRQYRAIIITLPPQLLLHTIRITTATHLRPTTIRRCTLLDRIIRTRRTRIHLPIRVTHTDLFTTLMVDTRRPTTAMEEWLRQPLPFPPTLLILQMSAVDLSSSIMHLSVRH